jgi:hypothetical protein
MEADQILSGLVSSSGGGDVRLRTREPGTRRQRGAVLVEAAMVTPILLTVVFAIFEFSLMFRHHLAVSNIAQQCARAASAFGRDPLADKMIIETCLESAGAIDDTSIEYIVIYRATGPDAAPQASCRNGNGNSGLHACNVYRPDDWNDPGRWKSENFGCSTPHLDKHFCPADRATRTSPPGWVGVHVKTSHSQATGLFGSTVTQTDRAVVRFEPESQQ